MKIALAKTILLDHYKANGRSPQQARQLLFMMSPSVISEKAYAVLDPLSPSGIASRTRRR